MYNNILYIQDYCQWYRECKNCEIEQDMYCIEDMYCEECYYDNYNTLERNW